MNTPRNTHADIFGTTTTPCPTWCDQLAGHGYDCGDQTMETRIHTRTVGTITVEHGRQVDVSIHAAENVLLGDHGTRVELQPVRCEVSAEAESLTADQALEVARLLTSAAAVLADLESGS